MGYIRHIPPSQAGGRLAQVYREVRTEVPRVPNFLQTFSLRPETMEGVYRLWLALMWSGRLPRSFKESLAVIIAKSSKCQYCADAHMIYLLASGMPGDRALDVCTHVADSEVLSPAERDAVRAAVRLTTDPRSMRAPQRAMLAEAWPDLEQRVELLSVVAYFNGVVRLANALGVDSEIPSPLLRFEAGKRGAIGLMARLVALSMDMGEKSVPAEPPDVDRAAFRHLFLEQLGFPSFPPGLEGLEACPEIFDAQLRALRKAVAVMPRDRWMRIGLVIGRLMGSEYFADGCGEWLRQRGENPAEVIAAAEGSASSLADSEQACLRFARDFTLHSHTIGASRIEELRRCGLSDGAILDLAYVAAVFNALVRLVLGLSPS